MKRILLSIVVLCLLSSAAEARLVWRSPRTVAVRRVVVRPYWVLPGQPVRKSVKAVGRCVGGVCHK